MRALALALALVPAIALGQLSVTATPMVRLGGVEGLRVIGDIPLIPAAATLTQSPVALVEIETQAKNITVEVTNQKRLPVQFQQVDPLIVAKDGHTVRVGISLALTISNIVTWLVENEDDEAGLLLDAPRAAAE